MDLSLSRLCVLCGLTVLGAGCTLDANERAQTEDMGTAPLDGSAPSAPDGPKSPMRGEPAELLVSLIDGQVMWWRWDGTLIRTLGGASQGPAFGMAFDHESKLYVTHGYTADLAAGNTIDVFDAQGSWLGHFGASYDCNPHSIAFDGMKRVYVGQADCEGQVLQFDATGVLLDSFPVATEERGAAWIALEEDGCTMLYTSQSASVKRYDVCARKQLDDFNAVPLPVDALRGSGANELKIVADRSVLVANFTEIVRLDADGAQVMVYDVVGPDGWRGLDLDRGGTSFWAVNFSTSSVVRFDLESGEVLAELNTETGPNTVKSVVVVRGTP